MRYNITKTMLFITLFLLFVTTCFAQCNTSLCNGTLTTTLAMTNSTTAVRVTNTTVPVNTTAPRVTTSTTSTVAPSHAVIYTSVICIIASSILCFWFF